MANERISGSPHLEYNVAETPLLGASTGVEHNPTVPVDTIPTHGGVNSIKSGRRRDRYSGLYHFIITKLREGNYSSFSYSELWSIMEEFKKYTRYVAWFNEVKTLNEQRRMYEFMMTNSIPEVQRLVIDMTGTQYIKIINLIQIVPLALDSLLERKRLMYRNIALILAAKARNIACFHRRFKDTFHFRVDDGERLDEYFIQRTMEEINYLELRPAILSMYNRAKEIRRLKEEREIDRRRCPECGTRDRRCRCDEPEPECEWCGGCCGGYCSGARKYERTQREWAEREEYERDHHIRDFFNR